MAKWRYSVTIEGDHSVSEVQAELNRIGKKGFELASSYYHPNQGLVLIYKAERPD